MWYRLRDVLALVALRIYALVVYVALWLWLRCVTVLAILLVIAIAIIGLQAVQIFPRVLPPTPRHYALYVPLLIRPPGLFGAGVASTSGGMFNAMLGATWFYVWGFCDAPCIPMLRNWELIAPSCPKILMLGNEPNEREPYGHSESPESAALISQGIRAQCPETWLVAPNVALPGAFGMNGFEWLRRYIDAGGQYDQLSAHCYLSPNAGAQLCVDVLTDFEFYFPDVPKCVSEYGSFNRDPLVFSDLVGYIRSHYTCSAAFTDRDASWYVYFADLNMVNDDGTLNEYGEIYKNRNRW